MFAPQHVHVETGTSFNTASLQGATSLNRNQERTAEQKLDGPSNMASCAHSNDNVLRTKAQRNCAQAAAVCGSSLVTVVRVVECFSSEEGIENRPMYGEKLQTLIPHVLRKAILGHSEVSHASTTILDF
ncbi:hypothetical protein ILYODFUR_001953 [Ilyodon furcidens]|uniref:Uncharacterized protein n=1 Tax=Ilyodon furcidens TaxID=33524 RepID=A0ABV0SI48_9TELE